MHKTTEPTLRATPSKRQLVGLAHHLRPLVCVGQRGVSKNLLEQIDGHIRDHELIKISLAIHDRDLRKAAIAQICAELSLELVQRIGKTATLYRKASEGEGKHSALLTL